MTVAMARLVGPQGRVVALEPQRILYHMLCANLALNALGNVEARQLAAGSATGSLRIPDIDYGHPIIADPRPLKNREDDDRVAMVALGALPLDA